jgi:hypothetical protein
VFLSSGDKSIEGKRKERGDKEFFILLVSFIAEIEGGERGEEGDFFPLILVRIIPLILRCNKCKLVTISIYIHLFEIYSPLI